MSLAQIHLTSNNSSLNEQCNYRLTLISSLLKAVLEPAAFLSRKLAYKDQAEVQV